MTQQPQFAAQIDWSNPITRGLAICRVGWRQIDTVNQLLPVSGTVSSAVSNKGVVDRFTAASSDGKKYASGNLVVGPSTVFALAKRNGQNAASLRLYSESNGASPSLDVGTAANTDDLSLTVGTSGTSAQTVSTGYFTGIAEFTGIGIVFNGVIPSPSILFYKNGLLQTTSVINVGTGTQNSRSTYSMFGNYAVNPTGTPRAWNGDIALGLVWNRALSASEIKSLSDNPWQIFLAPNVTPWVSP